MDNLSLDWRYNDSHRDYFGSKKGLFFAVVQWILKDYEQLKKSSNINLCKTPEEKLKMVFLYSVQYAMKYTRQTKFYLRYTLFIPEELREDINLNMEKTYAERHALYRTLLIECMGMNSSEIEIEVSVRKMKMLVDDCTFNVVFSNWQPQAPELEEIWNIFYRLQIKKSSYITEKK